MKIKSNLKPLLFLAFFLLVFHIFNAYAEPTSGFPVINTTSIVYTEEEVRDDYSILVPSTTTDGWFRDTYLFIDLDDYPSRVQRYRNAFIAAIMQPELTQRLKESKYVYAALRDLASETSELATISSKLLNLVSILKGGSGLNIFELDHSSIQTTLQNWIGVIKNPHISDSLSKLSTALKGVGFILNIQADVMDDIFLHAIANGMVLERLECIEKFIGYDYMNDPAVKEGFILAKGDVQDFLNEDMNVIQLTLNTFESHGADYILEATEFIPALVKQFGRITLSANLERVLKPYYLAYHLTSDMLADYEDIQSMCAAATLNSALLQWSWDQIDKLPNSSDPTFENARRLLLTTVQIRYGIGYWYNKKYDEVLALNLLSTLGWVKGLTQLITLQYSAVQDFRTDVLQKYMDLNYNYTIEINPYLAYNLQTQSTTDPPDLTLSDGSVSPDTGDDGDTFSFLVDYLDTSGLTPLEKKVYIDGIAYNMVLESGSPSNGTYIYSKNGLSTGVHNYRFSFKAGSGLTLVSPISGNHSGPTVNEDPDPDGRVKISVFWGSDSPAEDGYGGYVHPNVSWDQTFAPGQSQWFTAYPAFGWELDHWKIRYIWSLSPGSAYYYAPDEISGNSAMMITRDEERGANNWAENAIYCTFRRVHTDMRILTVSAVGPGSVDPVTGQYEHGLTDNITVTATPSADAAFVKWLLDGTEVSSATSYTFNMGSQDHSVEAVFQYNQTAIYTVDLPCIADASIRIEDFGESGDHYGYGSESRVGFKVNTPRNYTWDTAMKFDVSLIPVDAIIQDMYLKIYCTGIPNRSGIGYEIQKNTSAWDEDSIQSAQPTCLNPLNYNGSGLFHGGVNTYHDQHVSGRIPDAVNWISDWRSNNYGLRIRPSQYHVDDEYSYEGYYDFATRHVADTNIWPVLRVTYKGRYLAPQISTSSGSIEEMVIRGDSAPVESFTVWNSGEGTLNYTATTEAPWIQISGDTEASSDGEAHQINVGFDPSSLPLGYHEGSIVISDPKAENSPITIPVTLGILGPVISHDPPILTATVEAGYNAESSLISIWNSGQGVLNFSIEKSGSWLQLSPISGQSSGGVVQVNVDFDTDTLDPGTYYDTIYISDQNGDATTKEIPVEVTVIGRVAKPVLTPPNGTIGQNEISIALACSTPDVEIRYTLDGSEPVSTSSLYLGEPLILTDTLFVRAVAYHAGMLPSVEISGMYIVNHDPTGLTLSNSSVAEHQPEGTIVGRFSTTDQDIGNTFTYSLVSGDGDADNDVLTISGDTLKTASEFDYGTKSSFSIRVRATDQSNLWYEAVFNIQIVPAGDTTPPSPDPITWATVPYSTGISTVKMAASTATDSNGVEYYFDETSGNPGGNDSGWQDSPEYIDYGLQAGTIYSYQVRARDKSQNQNTTAWSSTKSVTLGETDTDGDGVPDDVENEGPNGGDGNNDTVPDSLQKNVTFLQSYGGGDYITLESPAGTTLSNCQAVGNPASDTAPEGIEFPYGFFDFTISGITAGGSTTLTLYFPTGAAPETYYKHGYEPGNPTDHWYEFIYNGSTGAEINGNVVTLHFIDADRGDDELTQDSMIIDLGGPGVASNNVTPGSDPDPGSSGGGSDGGGGGGGCFITTLVSGR